MKKLQVEEKYSEHWPKIAIAGGILCLLFFGGSVYVEDVLLEGYLRLTSFALFALSVFSFFKLKDGKINIELVIGEKSENILEIIYSVRDKEVHYDSLDIKELKNIKVSDMPNLSIYNDFYFGDKVVRFKKKNMDGYMHLIEIYGRIIPLSENNAKQITNFIEEAKK